MVDFPILEAFQGFIYAALTVTSLGVMGITAESCDFVNDCPGRSITAIVFAVLVFLLSLPLFAAYAFELSFLKRIERFLVMGIVLFNIVETAAASSPRNRFSGAFLSELSWWGLLLALGAFFLELSSGERPKFELSTKREDTETGTQPATTSSQPAQPTYTTPAPQPGAVDYTAPPPATG